MKADAILAINQENAELRQKVLQIGVQIIALQSRLDAAMKVIEPFVKYLSIPDSIPDDTWTECKTDDIPMTSEELAELKTLGVEVTKPVSQLLLWMDGVTIGDFRAAAQFIRDIAAKEG